MEPWAFPDSDALGRLRTTTVKNSARRPVNVMSACAALSKRRRCDVATMAETGSGNRRRRARRPRPHSPTPTGHGTGC